MLAVYFRYGAPGRADGKAGARGEVAEWLKAAVLKTARR